MPHFSNSSVISVKNCLFSSYRTSNGGRIPFRGEYSTKLVPTGRVLQNGSFNSPSILGGVEIRIAWICFRASMAESSLLMACTAGVIRTKLSLAYCDFCGIYFLTS